MDYPIAAIDQHQRASALSDAHRLVGIYTGKILNGAKLADLSVERSIKVELVINLKTAKALGIAVPQSMLVAADVESKDGGICRTNA